MLDIVNTIAAVGTFVVIAATAIAAIIQLRHLRASNQLQGLLDVIGRLEDEKIYEWFSETRRELPSLLEDPKYVRSVLEGPTIETSHGSKWETGTNESAV